MLFRLLLLFIAVPFIELTLLLYLTDLTSWKFTLGLVIVTGIIGSLLARSQGFRTYLRIQQELAEGRMPGTSLADAAMIFVAGALLLTPGILTDVVGFSLLLPPCRAFYRARLIAWFKPHVTVHSNFTNAWQEESQSTEVIDSYVVENPPEGESDQSPRIQ